MIFVTVGSSEVGLEFDRLIIKMDEIAGKISEEVLIQKGSSSYKTQHARSFDYASYQEMIDHYQTASFVVGHCGAGTILHCQHYHKHLITVPRELRYGELDQDDHQLELSRALKGNDFVEVIEDLDQLESRVRALSQESVSVVDKPLTNLRSKNLLCFISQYVQSVCLKA